MLVLTTKEGASVYIYVPGRKKPITVTSIELRNGAIRLGFGAEPDIKILREKIVEGIIMEDDSKK